MNIKRAVPIIIESKAQALLKLEEVLDKDFEILELRFDYYDAYLNIEKVKDIIKSIKDSTDREIIVTLRTKKEGGRASLSSKTYYYFNREIIISGLADYLDLEYSSGLDLIDSLISLARFSPTRIILSKHIFNRSLDHFQLEKIFLDMARSEGDIIKLAVDIESEKSLRELLILGNKLKEVGKFDYILLGMGKFGALSRIMGQTIGSYLTFLTVGHTTAIGQMALDDYNYIIEKYVYS